MGALYSITPFTLLDYPDELACIAWFAGCNLRCAYCHNPAIVCGQGRLDMSALTDLLQRRRGRLTGVVFSGGEPTVCPEIIDYARMARELGYKIKLDTNGTRPDIIADLLAQDLVDYVALDYKCLPEQSAAMLGTAKFAPHFDASLKLLIENQQQIKLEIRTTCHSDWFSDADLTCMIGTLAARDYRGAYYIQNIVSTGDKTLAQITAPMRQIDASKLPVPEKFTVHWRNFH
jgi:pyruvate formate lyase activating enzyme